MAYMSQTRKAELAPGIKAVLAKYGVKGTISCDGRSGLRVKIKSGKINFAADSLPDPCSLITVHAEAIKARKAHGIFYINPYHYKSHYQGQSREFLNELFAAMNKGNHDNSDIMSDYFDVGWYVYVDVGDHKNRYVVL